MDTHIEYTHFFLGVAFVRAQHLRYLAVNSWPDSCVGCCASNSENHIPVLITQDQYQTAVVNAGVANAELFQAAQHPKLEFSGETQLHCLHGEARLRNALVDTSREGAWLCVDLYQAKTSARIQRHLRQLYQQHQGLCDGDIYLMIRHYQRHQNHDQAERWLTKMSASKQKIFGQVRRNTSIAAALDDLEAFPALWRQFQLGSFPPILSWRCHEEIGHYLKAIFLGWKAICAENYHWCDEKTVQHVEGLAPRWSLQHKAVIENLCLQNQLFYRIETTKERDATVCRLLDQNGMILSFRTFYKHTKLLESTMLGIRPLFPFRRSRPTMMTALRSIYLDTNEGQVFVQYSDEEGQHVDVPGLTPFETSYLQLVLFGLRGRDAMASPKTRKQWVNTTETPEWLVRMACLASKLGFESDEIAGLQKLDPDRCRIQHHMRLEMPAYKFTVAAEDFELEAGRRYHEQRIFIPRKTDTRAPSMATSLGTDPLGQRSLQTLFLPSILNALQQQQSDQVLTCFGQEVLALCAFYDYFACNIAKVNDAASATRSTFFPKVTQWSPEPSAIISTSSKYSNQNSGVSIDDERGASHAPMDHEGDPNAGRVVNRSRQISFFRLEAGQPPRLSQSCPASKAEISSIMRELQRSCETVAFLLFYRGHLMISGAAAIYRHCVRQRRMNSIYYVTDAKSHQFWVGRSLNDAGRWNSYYRTEGPDW